MKRKKEPSRTRFFVFFFEASNKIFRDFRGRFLFLSGTPRLSRVKPAGFRMPMSGVHRRKPAQRQTDTDEWSSYGQRTLRHRKDSWIEKKKWYPWYPLHSRRLCFHFSSIRLNTVKRPIGSRYFAVLLYEKVFCDSNLSQTQKLTGDMTSKCATKIHRIKCEFLEEQRRNEQNFRSSEIHFPRYVLFKMRILV